MQSKIDAHCHVFDPVRFAYAADVAYRPQGQQGGLGRAASSRSA